MIDLISESSTISATLVLSVESLALMPCISIPPRPNLVETAGRYIEMFRQYGGSSLDPFLWFDFYYHGLIARKEVVRRFGGYDNASRGLVSLRIFSYAPRAP